MNIFFVDRDPTVAAASLCDKHVGKMLVESVQMLSTISQRMGGRGPMKPTHRNHPCTLWAGATAGNCDWLIHHALGLALEHRLRFGEHRAAKKLSEVCSTGTLPTSGDLTPPALAMPEVYKTFPFPELVDPYDLAVARYRIFYCREKPFAVWAKGRAAPPWHVPGPSLVTAEQGPANPGRNPGPAPRKGP